MTASPPSKSNPSPEPPLPTGGGGPDQGFAAFWQGLRGALRWAAVIALIPWCVHLLGYVTPASLTASITGIEPRRIDGLPGILFAPFLHSDLRHLSANTLPLFFLTLVSLTYSRGLTALAALCIILVGGTGVWIFGAGSAVHIGASGLIFGLIGYLLFLGLFRRDWKAILTSLLAFAVYGGGLAALLRLDPGVSWSSHFFGFAAGVLAAWLLRKRGVAAA